MANDKEITVEQKLRALYDLQLIDSRIDKIRAVRGELPLEVEDLEDEIAGLDTRLKKFNEEIQGLENDIKEKKVAIEDADKLTAKYLEQQKNVRNNREFDSLSKEIEFQDLEKQLAQRRIGEYQSSIIQKRQQIDETQEKLDLRSSHLQHKKAELEGILAETQKEEDLLLSKSAEYSEMIEDRLLEAYKRIRKGVRNGLAVVSIERGASTGSFFTIPPQKQMEVAQRKKIIIDEHSGRILVDPALAEEEINKLEELFSSIQ